MPSPAGVGGGGALAFFLGRPRVVDILYKEILLITVVGLLQGKVNKGRKVKMVGWRIWWRVGMGKNTFWVAFHGGGSEVERKYLGGRFCIYLMRFANLGDFIWGVHIHKHVASII